MTDLTNINEPFGSLPRETQLALFNAHLDGVTIETRGMMHVHGDWRADARPGWHSTFIYRARPTKPSIDWSHVMPEYKWLAMDEDGETWLFPVEDGPCVKTESGCWALPNTYYDENPAPAWAFASFRPGTCHWTESLVRRPL